MNFHVTYYFVEIFPFLTILYTTSDISLLNKAKMLAKKKSNKSGGGLDYEMEEIQVEVNNISLKVGLSLNLLQSKVSLE